MPRRSLVLAVVAVLGLAGCPRPAPAPGPGPRGPRPEQPPVSISWQRVDSPADVPAEPPAPGSWRVHLIDVGTGLSILVQGADFSLLYDAGTNDRDERPERVVAYLAAALGRSGDATCVEPGQPPPGRRRRLDHVVLSHPHLDHASALEAVLHCYQVGDIWDAGRVRDTVFYRSFLIAVSEAAGARYHTAAPVAPGRAQQIRGTTVTVPPEVAWTEFGDGEVARLGEGARFTVLHAEGKAVSDVNLNSIVIAVELGRARLLLVGDAPAGPRAPATAEAGEVEGFLLDHHRAQLRADILQVGHHGSLTSSRRVFLAAVHPRLALISSGPKRYGSVTLPDPEVVEEIRATGATVLRTDEHDLSCPSPVRIGPATGPGGCDSYVITIGR